jgi:hypothetical protein
LRSKIWNGMPVAAICGAMRVPNIANADKAECFDGHCCVSLMCERSLP